MARNSDNALGLSDSIVSCGPKGTTLPVDVTTALNAALKDVGWLTDAGIGESVGTDTNVKRGVNGAIVKTIRTNADRSFTFECYERNAVTMGLIRPGSIPATATGLTTTPVKAYLGTNPLAWVLQEMFGALTRRVCVPSGEAFLTGVIQDKPGDLAVLQFRIDCYPDSNGIIYTDITNNPAEATS